MFLLFTLLSFVLSSEVNQETPSEQPKEETVKQPQSTRRPQRRGGKPKADPNMFEADNGKCYNSKCSKNEL